jgi:glutathione S-transferase
MRLITIPFSHFSEKARWALDRAGLAYTEEPHLPVFNIPAARRAGGKTLPILVTDEGTFTDSTDILGYVDRKAPASRKIWPIDEAARTKAQALEDDFDRGLGKASRVYVYFHLLPEAQKLAKILGSRMSLTNRTLLRVSMPAFAPLIKKNYKVTEENARRSLDAIHAAFDKADAALAEGGTHLVGDTLTGADITFAALAAPVLCPPGHPPYEVALHELPLVMQPEVKRLRARPAGQHVLRLYEKERLSAFRRRARSERAGHSSACGGVRRLTGGVAISHE